MTFALLQATATWRLFDYRPGRLIKDQSGAKPRHDARWAVLRVSPGLY